jgi:hypothetical protein
MTAQVCPRCKVEAVIWSLDEDVSPFTQWRCVACGYVAEEDEAYERACSHCGSDRSSLLIRDTAGFHRWCCTCSSFEATTESFAGAMPNTSLERTHER